MNTMRTANSSPAIPESMVDIEQLIGQEKLLILLKNFGGRELRFNRKPGSQGFKDMEDLIGFEATEKLGALCGRSSVYLPMLSRWEKAQTHLRMQRRYDELLNDHKSARESIRIIASEFGFSERWTRSVINR